MTNEAAIELYWQTCLQALPPEIAPPGRQDLPEAWGFGNAPEHADELGELVREGIKTATCSLLWEYEYDGDPVPQPGELCIILDGKGLPMCLIQITHVQIVPFDEVDAQHAYEEGEGDRSLDYWREVHLRFFTPTCARIGRPLDPHMPLVCERFRLLHTAER